MEPLRDESPTLVPLPASPQSSRGEFDALIQLLTSDEALASNLEPDIRARDDQMELRDADGRLDFAKIKHMFVSSNSATGSINTKVCVIFFRSSPYLLLFKLMKGDHLPDWTHRRNRCEG